MRVLLENEMKNVNLGQQVVLIPTEELEAWLLCDPKALKTVFNMRRLPKISRLPETISSPKEFLAQVVGTNSKTLYLNTIHNKRIAKSLSISNLSRCPSFSRYPKFLEIVFPKATSRVSS